MLRDAGRESVEARTAWIEQLIAQTMAMVDEHKRHDPAGVERIIGALIAHVRSAYPVVPLVPDDIGGGCAA